MIRGEISKVFSFSETRRIVRIFMGTFSESISKRQFHTRINEGYCLICGDYGKLTEDHVPPQGSIAITAIEQKHIIEVIGHGQPRVRGVKSRNGSKFKTICKACNGDVLGFYDQELSRVCLELTSKINNYFSLASSVYNTVSVNVNALHYLRAMIGHILSATSVTECRRPKVETPYFTPLQNFVKGYIDSIEDTHDVYYWFFPYNMHLSVKIASFFNNGQSSVFSLLSFFPIAFMITEKGKGSYPSHSTKLSLNDKKIILDLSFQGVPLCTFPFHGLKGNQMLAVSDFQTIYSRPI